MATMAITFFFFWLNLGAAGHHLIPGIFVANHSFIKVKCEAKQPNKPSVHVLLHK